MTQINDAPGYLNPGYAQSLSAYGHPRLLPASGGWVLERTIAGGGSDAMGCYPLFCCNDWSRLASDLDALAGTAALASVALVTDPFGNWQVADLERCFPDRLIAFKDHHVIDLAQASPATLSKHHRYYARRALRSLVVEEATDPTRFTDEWTALYANLAVRHRLSGIRAFSRTAFAQQLALPGTVLLLARTGDGEIVGGQIWYVQGDVAYSHLAAVSERGYELMAAYALYWRAMEVFAGRVRYLDLGAGAGTSAATDDGLSRFKRGWATGVRPTYFCGRVLDADAFATAMAHRGDPQSRYFPAYREGEFG